MFNAITLICQIICMKFIINIAIFTVLFISSFNVPLVPYFTSYSTPIDRVVDTLPTANAAKISVNRTIFYEGDTIVLHFSVPNDPYLGVIDPDGHFFYIVFPNDGSTGNLKPYVDSQRFVTMKTMDIRTASFEADPYIYEVDKNRPVFTKSGDYTFIMGQNLHVDDPKLLHNVSIHYKRGINPKLMAGVGVEK